MGHGFVALAARGALAPSPGGLLGEFLEVSEPGSLGTEFKELLLCVVPQIRGCREVERERPLPVVPLIDVGVGQVAQQHECTLDFILGGSFAGVLERLDNGGSIGPALGELENAKATTTFHQYVHAPVLEGVDQLGDDDAGPDCAQALRVLENEAELGTVAEAGTDQLFVPVFEDMHRQALAWQQHQIEREESDLCHPESNGTAFAAGSVQNRPMLRPCVAATAAST
jgi:hypothetical protein